MFFRKLHRWLGLAMAVQIVAWMASGLYFSLWPIEEIRGEHLTRAPDEVTTAQFASLPWPAATVVGLDEHFRAPWTLESVGVVACKEAACWRIRGRSEGKVFSRLVDADGQVLPALTESQAATVARGWLRGEGRVAGIEWIETVAPDGEFRGGRLPAWRVSFAEPESLSLYLDPWTGEILARRTARWRVFDFFWMLHVMDFSERDDFSHPLLQVAAALGLAVALGGLILWALTTPLFRRRKTT
ncbi:MAG: PepSY domain-containing protein [Woeseiaceae bacterium]|nr:PepSY domain-containing protein [Woeseiaceae bacterium]